MNYLAHAYLGEQTSLGLAGAILGDFAKGRVESGDWNPVVARGIRLHRAIDRFTDEHEVHRRSRARFVPPRRRFAGIIVDICYDHFLCRDWVRFSDVPLPRFTEGVYRALMDCPDPLPERLQYILPRMAERDWLGSYGHLDRLSRTLDGVASRLRRGEAMRGAIEEVQRNYEGLEADFAEFFPELDAYAAQWLSQDGAG